MARIHELLRSVGELNPSLASEINAEIKATYEHRRAFGLNFERHTPETVELPGRKVRVGDKVHVLHERGVAPGPANRIIWFVESVDKTKSPVSVTISRVGLENEPLVDTMGIDELVVVAEFRDPIYPGLVPIERIERSPEKPTHAVINAENFHALEALMFTHRAKIDVIYIDPPYNTGNSSWAYNDDFVDNQDVYRHSKWLAFIERRLLLAKALLKPDGIVFVSIDDAEQARLKLLMDQVFGAENFVTSLIWKSKAGGANDSDLAVDHEYVLAYRASAASKLRPDSMQTAGNNYRLEDSVGRYVLVRLDQQNLQYSKSMDYDLEGPDGQIYRLTHADPTKPNATWRWAKSTVVERMDELVFKDGKVYTKNYEKDAYAPRSLMTDDRFGRTTSGSIDLKNVFGVAKMFDYPKPKKLIEHLLRISTNKDSVVLDFFGGSGTTTVATMGLNAQDGGTRQSILITNNEITQKQQTKLVKDGHRAMDDEWVSEGVFRKICLPRVRAEVFGVRPDGEKFSEGFAENVEFFDLTYEQPLSVVQNRVFERIAPILWLHAGATGRRIDELPDGFDVSEKYGVISNFDKTEEFVSAVAANTELSVVFVITEENRFFEIVAQSLPKSVEVIRLYDDFMQNFEIDTIGAAK
jgi:adenine-specific DNA-methyltransferase